MTVLVCGSDFGMGSAGKLDAILNELDDLPCVLAGTYLGNHIIESPNVERFAGGPLEAVESGLAVSVALVVNDADVAIELGALGVPVIYVDSLPYLWTEHDQLPVNATVYLAQLAPSLPSSAWPILRAIDSLRWVEPIVPRPGTSAPPRSKGRRALVNLGGMASPVRNPAELRYAQVVVPSALDALERAGFDSVTIGGSRSALASLTRDMTHARTRNIEIVVRALSHREFQEALHRVELVLSSPGSTTMFESQACSAAVALLPPQNVSQFLNAAMAASVGCSAETIDWSTPGLAPDIIESKRAEGELPAVEYVYDQIDRVAADAGARAELTNSVVDAITAALASPSNVGHRLIDLLGNGGARQVAATVNDFVLACRPPVVGTRQPTAFVGLGR